MTSAPAEVRLVIDSIEENPCCYGSIEGAWSENPGRTYKVAPQIGSTATGFSSGSNGALKDNPPRPKNSVASRKERGPQRTVALHCPTGLDAGSEVHVAHAAHAATRGHRGFLLRPLGHHRLGGDQQARNRCRILQGRAHDLGRIDDALGDQVTILVGLSVEAPVGFRGLEQLANHDRTVDARILGNLPRRPLHRLADDLDADPLVVIGRA